MPIPWLRLLDLALGVTNLAQSRGARDERDERARDDETSGPRQTPLAGVVAAALREVLERDARRMQMLREKAEADRQRAEGALRVELLRQAADREVGRLRLIAGCAVVSWIASMVAIVWLNSDDLAVRILLGGGMLLEIAALASAVLALPGIGDPLNLLAAVDDMAAKRDERAARTQAPLWLLVSGLVLVGLAVVL
ncbi:MAG: hypothetical protein HY047_19575 [Acidobacteria bacterium]|nr:hypothetical protein [Acidobacteriota bacterium]